MTKKGKKKKQAADKAASTTEEKLQQQKKQTQASPDSSQALPDPSKALPGPSASLSQQKQQKVKDPQSSTSEIEEQVASCSLQKQQSQQQQQKQIPKGQPHQVAQSQQQQQKPQQQPQVPQSAWPRQQVSQQPQVPQQAWPRQQVSQQPQVPQQAWPRQQVSQQPQVPQQAWPRQQVSQQPQAPQQAWPRQQISQQPQVPQQAWPRQQVSQRAWPQQQVSQQPQVPQQAWPRQQVSQQQQVPQSQQQAAQGVQLQQQKASISTQQQQGAQFIAGDHRQQPSTSTKTLHVSEFGVTDPFHSEIIEKTKMSSTQMKMYHDMIPRRAHPYKGGSLGQRIDVYTNMFKIIFDDNFVTNAVHYDVTVKPHKESRSTNKEPQLPKALCRNIFEQFRKKHFNNRYPAYDGKKNAFSANDLPFESDIFSDTFEHTNQNDRTNKYDIIVKKVANIDLSWIKNLKPGLGGKAQTAIQVLDIILRHAPESRFVNIGRSLFWNINEDEPLGGGLALARGGFMSGILGWRPYLNVDVSHKGFTIKQRVLTYIAEVVRVRENELTYENVMFCQAKIQSFLKNLKIMYEVSNTRRTHRIVELSKQNSYATFVQELPNGKNQTITIEKYFLNDKKYKIRRPDLPTLCVSKKAGGKSTLLPLECCTIIPNQPIRKLNEDQTTNMIKKATTNALTRKARIEDAFATIQVNSSPVMTDEFHLSVSKQMEIVPARILTAPELKYGRGKAQVKKGTWILQPFNEAKNLEKNSWTIVNFSGIPNIEPSMQEFVKMLQKTANEVGMMIGQPSTPFKTYRLQEINNLKQYFNDNKNLKLIIVIIPNRTDKTYGIIKKTTEMEVGVLTQCIKLQTLKKLDQFKQAATVRNILLKVNSKLNGVNHIFDKMPSCLNEQYPCMLVGADVTHPSPDSRDSPSVAAVAASSDKSAFRYSVALRLQPPKEEMILDLKQIILSQLGIYVQETKYLPKRIIYYRDGVSEGQLPQVMYYEIEAIKKAITEFTHGGNKGKIEITCLVVQKRHHIRLFPMSTEPKDTVDKNYNVKVGTIVDTTITHPEHIDFYLVSHASIQGTARPTKYRCIYNESKFTEDQLEELTYYLCHMYARCARSVSYPAPTYYAHLAAYRGRALLQGIDTFNLCDLEREQKNFIIKMGESPMYFV